jgi:hypothetical protein
MLKISKTSLAAIVAVAKKASGSGQLAYQLVHLRVNGNVISAVCFGGGIRDRGACPDHRRTAGQGGA